MGVTRILLLVVAVLWGLLCLHAFYGLAVGTYESIRLAIFGGNGTFLVAYSYNTSWAYFFVPAMLSYLAARDLRTVPSAAQEYFRFKFLGFLGWLGLVVIAGTALFLWRQVSFFGRVDFGDGYFWLYIDALFDNLRFTVELLWLGSLCLYARYRIAANKRLEAM